jgi:adenylate cyclase class IV
MAFEKEAKWVIKSDNLDVTNTLSYNFLPQVHLCRTQEKVFNILSKNGFENLSYKESIISKDSFYEPSGEFECKGGDFLIVKGLIKFSDTSLYIGPENQGNEPQKLVQLICDFSKSSAEPYQRQLRIRDELYDNKSILWMTGKNKLGIGDSDNIECEVNVSDSTNAFRFLNKIGYSLQPQKSKTKFKTKFGGDSLAGDYVCNIEIIKLPELEGVEFLEIEFTSENRLSSSLDEKLFKLAKNLGFQQPELTVPEGGNLENRGYQVLQKTISHSRSN